MNISLTPELEEFIQHKVQGGRYHTASEVVREGLRLLEARENDRELRVQRLRGEIQVGLDQIQQGRAAPLDMRRVKSEARKRRAGSG